MGQGIPRGRAAFAFAAGAIAYSVALLAWWIGYPAIEGESLLSHGGLFGLMLAAQSLPVSLLLFALLRHRCTRGGTTSIAVAWLLGSLFFVWSVLAGFSLAVGAMPAALLLMFAIGLTPKPTPAALCRAV